jgi:hypothetical protein
MKEFINPTKINQETVIANPELTKELAKESINNEIKEGVDVEAKTETAPEKTLNDLKTEMEVYRANIKKGETKNERGQYDEVLILENETKLREAEKELKRLEKEEIKSQKISELQNEITNYRQLIITAEKNNDEKGVLENEAKLREVEQNILNIEIESKNIAKEAKSYDKNDEPVFVEADLNLPIETRLSETPDGLQEWQIQYTDNPDIIKINRGFGWGEVSKDRLDSIFTEMPVHQNAEEEIAKIREELKNENEIDKSESLLKKRLNEEEKNIVDISDLVLLAGEVYLQKDPELKKFAFQLWSSDKVIKEIGDGFKDMDDKKQKEVIDKISNICGDKNLFIEKIKKLKEESEIKELKTEETPLEKETKTAETKTVEELNVETNKNWISEHFKNFEDDTEEAPKPLETPKPAKPKKNFWSGLKNIWSKK